MVLSELDAPNDTRPAKLSSAGVLDFDGGFEGRRTPEGGVARPDVGVGRILEKRELELIEGGFRALSELEVQLNPFRSSIRKEVQYVAPNDKQGDRLASTRTQKGIMTISQTRVYMYNTYIHH